MNARSLGGGSVGPPPDFPRMADINVPEYVDALAWYHVRKASYALSQMLYKARDEVVPLRYPHPDNPDLVGVPRTLAPEAPAERDHRAIGDFTFDAEFTSNLRPEQEPFVPAVFKMMENEFGGIAEAPTGFGKTTTACALIAKIGRPVCVVVPKTDLDWRAELIQHTTIPEDRIDTWQAQKLPDPNAWVVLATLQSVYRAGVYPQEVYNRFAAVIFDEVHRLGANELGSAMRRFPAMFRLGLSATPERRDGKMNLVRAHLGWRHVKGYTDAEQPDYYVIPSVWTEPYIQGKRVHYDPARTNPAKKSLIKDAARNASIAAAAYRAHKAGRRTIIFVEQIIHGERIKAALKSMGVPETRLVEYNGSVTAEGKKLAKQCPEGIILLATYKYTAEGTNIPALDTAIIAHPIYDPRQAVGRITRKHEGKPTPIVLDVWDSSCGTLANIASKRWEFLQRNGARWKGKFG